MIIKNAQVSRHLKGLDIGSNMGSILNLHFADDTLLFLDAELSNIEILKWFLISFEDLSGMKIKFSKCEMIPLNISLEDGTILARHIGCKLGSLRIQYLGVPLRWKPLTSTD